MLYEPFHVQLIVQRFQAATRSSLEGISDHNIRHETTLLKLWATFQIPKRTPWV